MEKYNDEKIGYHETINGGGERRFSVSGRRISIVDDVFGDIVEGGPNYRDVGWIGTAILMMKTQIGLGVLSIPAVLDAFGMVPGIICLVFVGVVTTWSNYMIGVFKLRHRSVYGIDDMGYKTLGVPGREFFGIAYALFFIFCAGSGMLAISIGLNAISSHGTCTAVFVAVAAVIGFSLASIQTLGKISFLAWIGIICILTAIMTVTIAVGVQDQPAAYDGPKPFVSDYQIVGSPSFTSAISGLSSLVFAFAGTPAFFAIVSEMRDPQLYTRSMLTCQSVVSIAYITIGVVVYYYCGSYVASPALGSAGILLKKIGYGFALPGLIVTTVLCTHLPAKYIFVRMLRGTQHLTENTAKHWIVWIGSTFSCTLIAYVIASAIPVFGGLVSLVGALLGTVMSFHPGSIMWIYDNWHLPRTTKWYAMFAWSIFVLISGTFLLVGGTYGSVVGILDSYKISGGSAAFSCADNSNSAGGPH